MQLPDVSRIVSTAVTWPGIHADPFQHSGTDFLLGRREIGHVHGNEHVDIPFPKRVRDQLVASGRAQPHHLLRRSGWVSIVLRDDADVERAIELLKLSYDLATRNPPSRQKTKSPAGTPPGVKLRNRPVSHGTT